MTKLSLLECASLEEDAAELARRADRSTNPAVRSVYLRASRLLLQKFVDDDKLIDDAENLLASGTAHSINNALEMVARAAGAHSARELHADVERLRRRLKKRRARKPSHEWSENSSPDAEV
ncbi:hypothetical protein [Bradyrhizobium sp. cf659]|uniref:hypothetical protein n=1 Tax=Bradyrhizobium sp. cf659 TaxID=1761771 RepID=UPI000B83E9D1|nr:hypothetical protein [Bradyrhizobium sp. cf659]